MRSRTLDLRLAAPAAIAWLATAVLVGLPGTAIPALVVAWLCAGTAAAVALSRRELASVALAFAAIALCCTSMAVQAPTRQPPGLDTRNSVIALGQTTQTIDPGRSPFAVTVSRVEVGDSVSTGAIPVLVFGETPATDSMNSRVGIGATVELRGTLVLAEAGDDIAYLLYTTSAPTILAPPPGLLDWANGLRASFVAAASRLPGDGGDLLAGLAIGDTSSVGDDLDSSMKATSLSHLTAVSGANCAIVIGLIMAAGAAVGLSRALRITLSLGMLVAFVVLVTPEPSVLRAALMAALVLLALARGRPVRGIPVLGLATLCLLVADPWLARSYGFVLSVFATAGLLLLAAPLGRFLARAMPRPLALMIAVPLAAQLACQPVIILLNASLPTYGVLANVLAEPAAPFATIVGLAGCVLLVILPPVGEVLIRVAWLPSAWIAGVARFFAAAPGAQLPWPSEWAGVALLTVVTVLVVLAMSRRWAVALLALALVGYIGFAGGARIATLASRPVDWQIAMCDVGQGDATVVRSAGQIALIDTGPSPAPLDECLRDLGIHRIDLLVLTHYDLDHSGGVAAVVGRVEEALVGPVGGDGERIIADLVGGGANVGQVARGQSGILGDHRWTVLWPPARLVRFEPGNDAGITLWLDPVGECESGCLSATLLADLSESAQQAVLAENPVAEVDVVKVAHHGSADQSPRTYERLNAAVGLIGVGADNDYGHPTDRLLEMLASVGTAVLRTDERGMILVGPGDDGAVRVWTSR